MRLQAQNSKRGRRGTPGPWSLAFLLSFELWILNFAAAAPIVAFSRITHGWTHYSTAFVATIDPDDEGIGGAAVASFYTPTNAVVPLDYGVITVWRGASGQTLRWDGFDYRVCIWSNLAAFTNSPEDGDVLTASFPAPTGGSTNQPDAFTRGGRPAWHLRFSLTNSPVALAPGHTYLVGFVAVAYIEDDGEFLVPTSSRAGPSDVQAGDIVPGGWQYLTNAGGSTIYSGQLACELVVEPRPVLRIERAPGGAVAITWPATVTGYTLEAAPSPAANSPWLAAGGVVTTNAGWNGAVVPSSAAAQFFRLNVR